MSRHSSVTKRGRPRRKLWIGLADVQQIRPGGVLGNRPGAFVNAISFATDQTDFTARVKKALKELDLELIEVEDIEPLLARLSKNSINRELRLAAQEAEQTGAPAFGTFHTYPDDLSDRDEKGDI